MKRARYKWSIKDRKTWEFQGQHLLDRKTENITGFPYCCGETHTKLRLLLIGSTAAKKMCFSQVALHRCRESSPHRTRVTTKLGERKLRQAERPRCQVSRGLAWDVGGWPSYVSTLCYTEQEVISDQKKKSSKYGSGSHVPIKTLRHRPPTALEFGRGDSQLSGAYALHVWWYPCPVRRGLVAAVKYEKHVYLL